MAETARSRTRVVHPLHPLTAPEIGRAAELVKGSGQVGERPRFVQVSLHEPPKAAVAGYEAGERVEREALAVVLYRATGTTYEALVSLSDNRVRSCDAIDGVQPPIQIEEFLAAEEIVKQNRDWQAALRRRGITDFEHVQVDPWVTGHFGLDVKEGRRLVRAVSYVRDRPDDNGYARPIEGVIAFVDLNRGEVARIEDHGAVPLPGVAGRYDTASVAPLREAPRPNELTQPEGPSFSVDGHEVSWQRWRFRLSLHPTEGLVLHTVGYEDGGRLRAILHRAALSEMVVPYGETSPMHAWKNAFDAGEYGFGKLTNPLELGCDCVGEVVYFDGVVVSEDGEAVTIPNAVCMHEEDYGILWKHTDYVTDQSEVRRSRRLVVSAIHTVGNYDYGFFWYLYQDGTIDPTKRERVVSFSSIAGWAAFHGYSLTRDYRPSLSKCLSQHVLSDPLLRDHDRFDESLFIKLHLINADDSMIAIYFSWRPAVIDDVPVTRPRRLHDGMVSGARGHRTCGGAPAFLADPVDQHRRHGRPGRRLLRRLARHAAAELRQSRAARGRGSDSGKGKVVAFSSDILSGYGDKHYAAAQQVLKR